ncbi:MAG: DUF4303 domain-containing protein [Gemmataceae bacterium]|nr:DUF4303 domain-containing protein [Gemmataceae bacterium]
MPDFDFKGFEASVVDLAQQGVRFIQERHPDEHFYVYGFLTRPLRHWPIPIGNSEEALSREAEKRVAEGRYLNVETAKRELRWEPSEWPYGEEFGEAFETHPAWDFGESLLRIVDSLDTSKKEGSEKFDRFMEEIDDVYYRALNSLRENASPTPQVDFKKVLLGLFQYDQGDQERLDHAKRVNPPDVYARYDADVMPTELRRLIDMYRQMGMPSYSDLAYAHFRGSTEGLTKAIFQTEALKLVLQKGDTSFIDEARKNIQDSNPTIQEFGQAVQRMLQAGASPQDMNVVIREMQYQVVFFLCHMLTYPPASVADNPAANWRLFQVDQEVKPVKEIDGLIANMRALFENLSVGRA